MMMQTLRTSVPAQVESLTVFLSQLKISEWFHDHETVDLLISLLSVFRLFCSAGLCQREGTKRWSYLSSFDSRSDISADITNQEAALGPQDWLDQTEPGLFSPVITSREEDQWNTSTPEEDANEPMKFDGGRVKAWLRVQSSAPSQNTASCSRAVQTDGDVKVGSLFSVSSVIQQDAGSEAGSNLALV
ncbi:hypothetical protein XENOCAPTIV_013117 [Xenoophorus captivus]|uniref:Uncharacterized protein n=1 Tax=Xenoophorus captivus TaxID=1517983 RepID=A0ABV0QE90_9TELE